MRLPGSTRRPSRSRGRLARCLAAGGLLGVAVLPSWFTAPPTTALAGMASPVAGVPALMPLPAALVMGRGSYPLTADFTVAVRAASPRAAADGHLAAAAARLVAGVRARTGMFLPDFNPATPSRGGAVILKVDAASPAVPAEVNDEAYTLTVTPTGVVLAAHDAIGIQRGVSTLLQLVAPAVGGAGFALPALTIRDHPRFAWRGLSLDVARHFMPVAALHRTLDLMALVKLDVLHLHLSDDQGFRVESRTFPKLTALGSDGDFYTQEQIRGVIAHAADLGIRVVPEFDMPGHASSWLVGYPGLASGPGPYAIERHWGIFDPAFDPTREETYQFIDRFLSEMTTLFPDADFHIGGDEVNGVQWRANPRIQAFIVAHHLKDGAGLQAYFTSRLQGLVARHGKRAVGWDEIMDGALPPEVKPRDVIIESWRNAQALEKAAAAGHPGLLAAGYYLDLSHPAGDHYRADPVAPDLPAALEPLILGGEACAWSERFSPENLDIRLWPRLAVVAEKLWSPRAATQDVAAMYARLPAISTQLEWDGSRQKTAYEAMLGRLAADLAPLPAGVPAPAGAGIEGVGEDPAAPLRPLAEVVEPLKDYRRSQVRPDAVQSTPLNRLVDTVPAESAVARRFSQAVGRLLANPMDAGARAVVESDLRRWRAADAVLAPRLAGRALVGELAGPSRALAEVAALGQRALAALPADPAGKGGLREAGAAALLDRDAQPGAELELAIVPAVRRLVAGR